MTYRLGAVAKYPQKSTKRGVGQRKKNFFEFSPVYKHLELDPDPETPELDSGSGDSGHQNLISQQA